MIKSITIFGGSGFIGGSFYDFYTNRRNSLKVLNLISRSAKKKYLPNKRVKLIEYDIEKNIGEELPESTDLVFYAVDNTDYSLYEKKISNKLSNKIKNFIKICKKKYRKSKIIFISSGSVYGRFDQDKKFKENFKFYDIKKIDDLKKYYIHNKRLNEKIFKKLGKEGFKTLIARCFTFIGPRIPLNKHFLIGNLIKKHLQNKILKVKSNRKVFRSYMYSDDMVRWLVSLEKVCSNRCPIFNVGSDQEISLDKILYTFTKVRSKVKKRKKLIDYYDYYVPDISKIQNTLNLKYENNFEKILKKTIKNVKNIYPSIS